MFPVRYISPPLSSGRPRPGSSSTFSTASSGRWSPPLDDTSLVFPISSRTSSVSSVSSLTLFPRLSRTTFSHVYTSEYTATSLVNSVFLSVVSTWLLWSLPGSANTTWFYQLLWSPLGSADMWSQPTPVVPTQALPILWSPPGSTSSCGLHLALPLCSPHCSTSYHGLHTYTGPKHVKPDALGSSKGHWASMPIQSCEVTADQVHTAVRCTNCLRSH